MRSISIFMLAVLLISFSACKKADITPTTELNCNVETSQYSKSAQLESLLNEYTAKGLPGISLMVSDPTGAYIGAAGMADIEKGVMMKPCHIAKTASVTKMVVAVLTMKLQEEGKLNISEPITKYMSEEELEGIPNTSEVIIHDLLRHTTGFYDVISSTEFYLAVLNNPTRQWTAEELLDLVRGKEPDFAPNTSAGYSNTNYLLLHMIIEKATGRAVEDLLKEKIFTPIGMNDTYYHWKDPLPENKVAQGYFDLYQNNKLVNLSNWNTGSGNGYGGLFSTVIDMHKFMKAFLRDKTILSQASIDQMLTFNEDIVESRKYLGTGVFKDFIDLKPGLFAYGHRGRDLAYTADLFYFPQSNAIMALEINYGNDSESDLRPVFYEFRDKLALIIGE